MTKPNIRLNTPNEEAEIKKQIAADPDTWEASADATVIRRGRPRGLTKQQVTVRIDREVLVALKGENEKGWQTRMNAILRKTLLDG